MFLTKTSTSDPYTKIVETFIGINEKKEKKIICYIDMKIVMRCFSSDKLMGKVQNHLRKTSFEIFHSLFFKS